MDALSIASAQHKAELASLAPWHVLLTLTPDPVNAPDVSLRVAREPDDVPYRGNLYVAFNFDFDLITDKATGELQQVQLKVANVNRVVESYLAQYKGAAGAQVQIDVVSDKDMQGDPAQTFLFGVQSSAADVNWVTLTLGGTNPVTRSFLRFLYFSTFCPWVYNAPGLQATCDVRGAACGYWGPLQTCAHTLADCEAHGNVLRFGGYPGLSTQGFSMVTPA